MDFNIVKLQYKPVFDVLKYLEVTIMKEKGYIAFFYLMKLHAMYRMIWATPHNPKATTDIKVFFWIHQNSFEHLWQLDFIRLIEFSY